MAELRWFINGHEGGSLSMGDRGLAYGDGLFETMRVIGSDIPLLDLHQARLFSSCEKLGIDLDKRQLIQQVDQALGFAQQPQSVIKLIVTRGGDASGYTQTEDIEPNIYIRLSSLKSQDAPAPDHNLSLPAQLCKTRLSIQPELAGIKHLSRLEQVLAAREIREPNQEGILMDTLGYVVEAISSNLIIVHGSNFYRPDLSSSGVEGVMQSCISELLANEGIEIKTAKMTFEDFCQSSEIIVCNSVRGIRNISTIEGVWEGTGMQFGIQLRELLNEKLGKEFYSF